MEKVLEETGVQVIKASSGNEALVCCLRQDFVLAIVDVQMPEMDGYELAEIMRSDRRTQSIPIIFLTAVYSDEHHLFRGYEAGAVDFITKPYNPKLLVSKVKVYLELDRRRRELEVKNQQLEGLFDHAPAGLALFDAEPPYRVLAHNDVYQKFWPEPFESRGVVGLGVSDFAPSAEEEGFMERFREVAEKGEGKTYYNIPYDGLSQGRTWWNFNLSPVYSEGKLVTFSHALIEVTAEVEARQALEAQLEERRKMEKELIHARDALEVRVSERTSKLEAANRALERSNQALQEFSSIASHDMQEPLRKIRTFGDQLKRNHGECLTGCGADYLDRMLGAASRMQKLLEALLDYSRLSTRADPFVRVNLGKVVREVIEDLDVRISETEGRVEVGELPTIEAASNQMRQLFQNLLGNALKYHGQNKPFVRVFSEPGNGREHRILVQDNGIGFDEKYLERIFAPFQRLHGRSEYHGTGMGLAICKKIVERHGGDISAKSVPGKGSTFIISLPEKQNE